MPKKNNKNDSTFESRYHTHPLNKAVNGALWICDICNTEYTNESEVSFRCKLCNFDICKNCKSLEESGATIDYVFLSKSHSHLLKDENKKDNTWFCDVCSKSYKRNNSKRFRCSECNFNLCDDCKKKEELERGLNNLNID